MIASYYNDFLVGSPISRENLNENDLDIDYLLNVVGLSFKEACAEIAAEKNSAHILPLDKTPPHTAPGLTP